MFVQIPGLRTFLQRTAQFVTTVVSDFDSCHTLLSFVTSECVRPTGERLHPDQTHLSRLADGQTNMSELKSLPYGARAADRRGSSGLANRASR